MQPQPLPEPAKPSVFAEVIEHSFLPTLSSWTDSLFSFRYTVKITNRTNVKLVVERRCWKIHDYPQDGLMRVVKVDSTSVGGATSQPVPPGEFFTYTTLVPLRSAGGWMEGHFSAKLEDGQAIQIAVPRFNFNVTARELEACLPNRAHKSIFLEEADPSELLLLQSLLDGYQSKIHRKRAELTIQPEEGTKLSAKTIIVFQRLLLQRFLGEYEKIELSKQSSTLYLSEINRHFPDVIISDIYAISKNGTDFAITFYFDNRIRVIDASYEQAEPSAYGNVQIEFGQLKKGMSRDEIGDEIGRELDRLETLYGWRALQNEVGRRASARAGVLDPGRGPATSDGATNSTVEFSVILRNGEAQEQEPHTGLRRGNVDDPVQQLMERVKDRPDVAKACLKFIETEITRPEYAKMSAELTEARLDREREQRRQKQARYRNKRRPSATAEPT